MQTNHFFIASQFFYVICMGTSINPVTPFSQIFWTPLLPCQPFSYAVKHGCQTFVIEIIELTTYYDNLEGGEPGKSCRYRKLGNIWVNHRCLSLLYISISKAITLLRLDISLLYECNIFLASVWLSKIILLFVWLYQTSVISMNELLSKGFWELPSIWKTGASLLFYSVKGFVQISVGFRSSHRCLTKYFWCKYTGFTYIKSMQLRGNENMFIMILILLRFINILAYLHWLKYEKSNQHEFEPTSGIKNGFAKHWIQI